MLVFEQGGDATQMESPPRSCPDAGRLPGEAAICGMSLSRIAKRPNWARLLTGGCQPLALVLNRVFDDHRPDRLRAACKLGCEGIVLKRRASRYARGRSSNWLKVKNLDAPAVRREEDWGGPRETDPSGWRTQSRA